MASASDTIAAIRSAAAGKSSISPTLCPAKAAIASRSPEVVRNGESIRIKMAPLDASLPRPLEIVLVRYLPHAHVEIRAGENAGRSVDYTNIVRDWRAVAEWDGASAAVIETEWQGDLPGAVLLQEEGPGAVLAAARLR